MSAMPATTTATSTTLARSSSSCVCHTGSLPAIWRGNGGIWGWLPSAPAAPAVGRKVFCGSVSEFSGPVSRPRSCGTSRPSCLGVNLVPIETRFRCSASAGAASSSVSVGGWSGDGRCVESSLDGWIASEFEEFGGYGRWGSGIWRRSEGESTRRRRSGGVGEIFASRGVIAASDLDGDSCERRNYEAEEAEQDFGFGGANWGAEVDPWTRLCDGDDSTEQEQGGGGKFLGRRGVLFLLMSAAFSISGGGRETASAAFSPGFSGLKDWLKGQKQKTAGFLLAPIIASRDRLASALLLVSSESVLPASYEEAGKLVKVAARDCMPATAGSFQEFQKKGGIEVCTFKLVLKNAASLRDNNDPVKLDAEESLTKLVRSFITLDEMLASGATGGALSRGSVLGALSDTSQALSIFEGSIRTCLDIA